MRKLTPTTIIPPSLYVRRSADRQLQQVIEDMGRPGYILVARQMGKTNLLLNAKRELENEANVVAYVDLSAPFSTDRECFRHIIDICLETNPNKFKEIHASILGSRSDSSLPAYKEHEIEIRRLLTEISGKLVIVLDEIDSLTKSNFSDRIFAQIRSVYFSRTNYPQFNRLTYILSGVAEPTEIIKDKKISPFNIGEKIYLDDFSLDEFKTFLQKSELNVSQECADRIYYWTQGNPRITWDLCSEIESNLFTGHFVTPESIDSYVAKLYLADFSRPPVDHIREVVSDDDGLQNAITVIKYGKGEALSDSLKSKLYLSGIIRSSGAQSEIKIKNPIIYEALSDQWLRDIAINKKGLLKLADEKFGEGKFTEALDLYEAFLKLGTITKETGAPTFYHSGVCAYRIGSYERAMELLSQCAFDSEGSAAAFAECEHVQGVCLLQLREFEVAIQKFQPGLRVFKKNFKHIAALINTASAHFALERYTESLNFLQRSLDVLAEMPAESDETDRLSCLSYIKLSSTYSALNQRKEAFDCLQLALQKSKPQTTPVILIEHFHLDSSAERKKEHIRNAIRTILENQIKPSLPHPENAMLLTQQHVWLLLKESYLSDKELFDKFYIYVRSISEFDLSHSEMFLNFAIFSLNKLEIGLPERFLKASLKAFELEESTPFLTKFKSTRLLCLFSSSENNLKLFQTYLDFFSKGFRPNEIDNVDLAVFPQAISAFTREGLLDEALNAVRTAHSLAHLVSDQYRPQLVFIYLHEMIIRQRRNEALKLRRVAEETLRFIDTFNEDAFRRSGVDTADWKNIQQMASHTLNPSVDAAIQSIYNRPTQPKRISVRYLDGRIKKDVKYSQVEQDLRSKKCVIV